VENLYNLGPCNS